MLKNKVTPSSQVAVVGATVVFKCASDERVTWKFDGEPLPHFEVGKTPGMEQYWLKLGNVQLKHSGTYTCHGKEVRNITGNEENVVYFENKGVLIVFSKSYSQKE